MIRAAMGWTRRALEPHTVRRALRYAVIVGALLVVINHGDAVLHGDLSQGRLLRMALTAIVPYIVSTLSSLEAESGSPVGEHRGGPEERSSR